MVHLPRRGIIINEPSVVAVSIVENKVLAVGNEAKEMLGRTPDTIQASRPMKDGVIADYKITEAMLKYFINKVSGRFRLVKPEVVISIPVGVTSTERRAVVDAAIRAGAKVAYVVKEPMLAAIGASIPISAGCDPSEPVPDRRMFGAFFSVLSASSLPPAAFSRGAFR